MEQGLEVQNIIIRAFKHNEVNSCQYLHKQLIIYPFFLAFTLHLYLHTFLHSLAHHFHLIYFQVYQKIYFFHIFFFDFLKNLFYLLEIFYSLNIHFPHCLQLFKLSLSSFCWLNFQLNCFTLQCYSKLKSFTIDIPIPSFIIIVIIFVEYHLSIIMIITIKNYYFLP